MWIFQKWHFFKPIHNAVVIPDKINNNSSVSSNTQCVVRFPPVVPKMSELVYRFKSQIHTLHLVSMKQKQLFYGEIEQYLVFIISLPFSFAPFKITLPRDKFLYHKTINFTVSGKAFIFSFKTALLFFFW